jgi:hypothetical protein
MQQPVMEILKWIKVIDDTIFVFGTVALAWFIFVLKDGWSIEKSRESLLIIFYALNVERQTGRTFSYLNIRNNQCQLCFIFLRVLT